MRLAIFIFSSPALVSEGSYSTVILVLKDSHERIFVPNMQLKGEISVHRILELRKFFIFIFNLQALDSGGSDFMVNMLLT